MTDVQFEDSNVDLPDFTRRPRVHKGLIGFVINKGWARDERMANAILISVIVLCLIIIFIVISRTLSGSKSQRISPEEIQQLKHLPRI